MINVAELESWQDLQRKVRTVYREGEGALGGVRGRGLCMAHQGERLGHESRDAVRADWGAGREPRPEFPLRASRAEVRSCAPSACNGLRKAIRISMASSHVLGVGGRCGHGLERLFQKRHGFPVGRVGEGFRASLPEVGNRLLPYGPRKTWSASRSTCSARRSG